MVNKFEQKEVVDVDVLPCRKFLQQQKLLLGCGSDLGLLCSPDLLRTVLLLLLLISADLLLPLDHTLASQSVLGLKLLSKVHGVVDESEA